MDCVHVGNLPPDICITDIDDIFIPFGKLVFVDVNYKATPVNACVQFDSPRNAFNAVKSRNGYNYNGYRLHLRLVESNFRESKTVSSAPPAPPFFVDNNGCGFNQNSRWLNSSSSQIIEQQQNMMDYQRNNSSNMHMQSFSSNDRFDGETYYNSNRSNMQQQFLNSNRSNISQQNYSYRNHSQNTNYSDNDSTWNCGNNNMNDNKNMGNWNIKDSASMGNWNGGNNNNGFWSSGNNNTGNMACNFNNVKTGFGDDNYYNPEPDIVDDDDDQHLDSRFTAGFSDAGCKLFKRHLSRGFTPEEARRKVCRKSRHKSNLIDEKKAKRVSREVYRESAAILSTLKRKSLLSDDEKILKKFHEQIRIDYERFGRIPTKPQATKKKYKIDQRLVDKQLEKYGKADPATLTPRQKASLKWAQRVREEQIVESASKGSREADAKAVINGKDLEIPSNSKL